MSRNLIKVGTAINPVSLDANFANTENNFIEVYSTLSSTGVIANGILNLGTTTIPSNNSIILTASAPGVVAGENIIWSYTTRVANIAGYTPATSGRLQIDDWTTANNVNFEIINATSSNITPGSANISWKVIR